MPERRVPMDTASMHKGRVMEGLDGRMYKSVKDARGRYYWQPKPEGYRRSPSPANKKRAASSSRKRSPSRSAKKSPSKKSPKHSPSKKSPKHSASKKSPKHSASKKSPPKEERKSPSKRSRSRSQIEKRRSPMEHAADHKGKKMMGADGVNHYISVPDKNGRYFWTKLTEESAERYGFSDHKGKKMSAEKINYYIPDGELYGYSK